MNDDWQPMPDFKTWLRDRKGMSDRGRSGEEIAGHFQRLSEAFVEYATEAVRNMEKRKPSGQ